MESATHEERSHSVAEMDDVVRSELITTNREIIQGDYPDEAKKQLASASEDFTLANPGQRLKAVETAKGFSIEIEKDSSYSELDYIAARTLSGVQQAKGANDALGKGEIR